MAQHMLNPRPWIARVNRYVCASSFENRPKGGDHIWRAADQHSDNFAGLNSSTPQDPRQLIGTRVEVSKGSRVFSADDCRTIAKAGDSILEKFVGRRPGLRIRLPLALAAFLFNRGHFCSDQMTCRAATSQQPTIRAAS